MTVAGLIIKLSQCHGDSIILIKSSKGEYVPQDIGKVEELPSGLGNPKYVVIIEV